MASAWDPDPPRGSPGGPVRRLEPSSVTAEPPREPTMPDRWKRSQAEWEWHLERNRQPDRIHPEAARLLRIIEEGVPPLDSDKRVGKRMPSSARAPVPRVDRDRLADVSRRQMADWADRQRGGGKAK